MIQKCAFADSFVSRHRTNFDFFNSLLGDSWFQAHDALSEFGQSGDSPPKLRTKLSANVSLIGRAMVRGLRAQLSPHEEVTLRRIALGIAKAKLLPVRDVAYLVRPGLVDESDGRLSITALGRQRYEDMPRPVEPSHKDEAAALVASELRQARDY